MEVFTPEMLLNLLLKKNYSKSSIRKMAETFTGIFGNERARHQRGGGQWGMTKRT
jgi:hypothetical protein